MKLFIHSETSKVALLNFGNMLFYTILYNGCNYLSTLKQISILVSKRDPRSYPPYHLMTSLEILCYSRVTNCNISLFVMLDVLFEICQNKAYQLDLFLMSSYYIWVNTSSKEMDRSASVSDFIRLSISGKWYLVENNPIKY